ncbi:MAG: ATP-binding cassette domain-containing protein [Candidatus Thermoplasmatota archaeon]|jgi:ABC-2 type transport system ATP-binding protein|nr:ATP-binding cassette domain-containing protein [Candidatus Thermoplasmatota archaeon]
MTETIIKTENLTKTYSGSNVKAVDNLNIEIMKGEIYGLLGPNGAGKTTTISMLSTRVAPSGGKAIVAGYDIIKDSLKVRKVIGVVPQDLTTDEDLSGYENLMMVASFYDVNKNKAKEKAAQLLRLVDLEEAANKHVKTYSGGMRKRLELIVGLINEPEILFLDEPTLGLDVQTRSQMWKYIRDIQEKLDVTIILTSHYLDEIDALSSRVTIIDHGKVLVTGTSEELKAKLKGDIIMMTFKTQEEAEKIKEFPNLVDVKDNGPKSVRLKVQDSDRELPNVIEFISKNQLSLTRMTVQKPSLDDVFLEYTGKGIRDAEGGGEFRQTMFNMRRLRR